MAGTDAQRMQRDLVEAALLEKQEELETLQEIGDEMGFTPERRWRGRPHKDLVPHRPKCGGCVDAPRQQPGNPLRRYLGAKSCGKEAAKLPGGSEGGAPASTRREAYATPGGTTHRYPIYKQPIAYTGTPNMPIPGCCPPLLVYRAQPTSLQIR